MSFRPTIREDTCRISELFKTTSGYPEHLWSTMAPEYPVLTQGRKVKRLCDRCGAFRAGQLARTSR